MHVAVVRLFQRVPETLGQVLGGGRYEQTAALEIGPRENLMQRVVLAGALDLVPEQRLDVAPVGREEVPVDMEVSVRDAVLAPDEVNYVSARF